MTDNKIRFERLTYSYVAYWLCFVILIIVDSKAETTINVFLSALLISRIIFLCYVGSIVATLNKNVWDVPDHIIDDLNELGVKPKLNQGFSWDQSLHWITDLGNRSQDFTNIIIDLGYDGVIYGSELVLFEPNQIKSVDNDGSWDFNDDNIFS